MRTILTSLGCAAFVLLAGACGTARRSEPIVEHSAAQGEAFAKGRHVFMKHCHTCHPGGEAGLAPALNNKPLPAALIKYQVRHGLGAMPAFDSHHITSDELDALAAYLVALRKAE